MIANFPALNNTVNTCALFSGVISITNPGCTREMVP
jgi:hypothetical protein